MKKVRFTLRDNGWQSIPGREEIQGVLEITHNHIDILIEGYGTSDAEGDSGPPVFLELWNGELRVVVAPDINSDNMDIISLEKARVELYEEVE